MFNIPFRAFAPTLLLTGLVVAQDKKTDDKKDDPPAKAKGFLPQNWKALGLTDSQKQDVYRLQTKYNAEIDKLKAQIEKLKAEEKDELMKVLTPDQKKQLIAIKTGEKPAPEKDKPKDK